MLVEIVQWESWIVQKNAMRLINSSKNKLNNKISWQKKKLVKHTLKRTLIREREKNPKIKWNEIELYSLFIFLVIRIVQSMHTFSI